MTQVSLEQLVQYLGKTTVLRNVNEIVLHHTWSPTAAQYRGIATWQGIRRYHVETKKWSDIGYHFGIGPDKSIWRLRPVEKSGAHVLGRNANTIGVALVGNHDVENPAGVLPTAAEVFAALMRRFRLSDVQKAVRFHREFSSKTCPGTLIGLPDFRRRVAVALGQEAPVPQPEPVVVYDPLAVVIGSSVVPCSPVIVDNRLRVLPGPYCAALGSETVPEIRIDRDGRAQAVELTAKLPGWVLGAEQYQVITTPDGQRLQRWYPKRGEWMQMDGDAPAGLEVIPQAWAERYDPLPAGWWEDNAPGLAKLAPGLPEYVNREAARLDVDPRLVVTRMQLEQSALTYAWDNSRKDYPGGDADKLKYLCGVDRTDSGDRPGGWFGWDRQILGCMLRFKHWYRGEDGPDGLVNWLGLRDDPAYRPGVPVQCSDGVVTPANQASADCLRYTPRAAAAEKLREIGLRYFPSDYAVSAE